MPLLKYCEDLSACTAIAIPAAAALSLYMGWWRSGTPRHLAIGGCAATTAWLCWQRFVSSGWRWPLPHRVYDAHGKVAIVTGANTGIGFWTAVGLVQGGVSVLIVTCRDEAKCADTVARLTKYRGTKTSACEIIAVPMELASLSSVRAAAARIASMGLPIHVLINNAGAAVMPTKGIKDAVTEYGAEANFGNNFIAAVLFTAQLLPLLSQTKGRIVNVGSRGHERVTVEMANKLLHAHPHLTTVDDVAGFRIMHLPGPPERPFGYRAYCFSKLGNTLHAQYLARQHPKVCAVSLHPGRALTDVWRSVPVLVDRGLWGALIRGLLSLHLKTAQDGAATVLYCALSADVETGAYYADSRRVPPSSAAQDRGLELQFMTVAQNYIDS